MGRQSDIFIANRSSKDRLGSKPDRLHGLYSPSERF